MTWRAPAFNAWLQEPPTMMLWTFRCPHCGTVLYKALPTDRYACAPPCGWREEHP